MTTPYLGEALSALAPLAWAFAVILFRKGGDHVGPLALNLFKNTVGLALLLLTLTLVGGWGHQPSRGDLLWLVGSGVVGIALADTLFFWALNLLGASRLAVVGSSYTPTVLVLSFVFLGDRLNTLQWVGTALVVAAVVLAASAGGAGRGDVSRRRLLAGTLVGMAAMSLMATGVVMAKAALDRSPVVWASTVRLAAGAAALLPLCLAHPDRRTLLAVFVPSAVWRSILPGAVVGTYLAYMLWLGGMKFASVSVAAVLNQLHILFTPVLAFLLLRERIGPRVAAGIALGLLGSGLVVLG